ncbi:MAG: PQQ-binding-like beta-propeller repeat protein [Pirellula sp.]|jgi:outer membrane protein assembly factor BamB
MISGSTPRVVLTHCLLSFAAISIGLHERVYAEDWTRFRGQNGSGVAESHVMIPWESESVERVRLLGSGNGSPVVWNDRAFLMSADPNTGTRYLLAYDLKSGSLIWKQDYRSRTYSMHKFSSYASTTPCVDEDAIYSAWADPDQTVLVATSHDGNEIWRRDFGRYVSQHGFGTSPICVGELVILLNSQDALELPPGVEPGQDRMVALNRKTGDLVWETELPTSRVCYGVPCVWDNPEGKELVCSTTAQGMFGLDLATGKLLWNHQCYRERICSSSILIGDLLIGTQGSGGGKGNTLVALDLNTKQERFRVTKSCPYVPSPVANDQHLFLWGDAGIVTCVDPKEGKTIWTDRVPGDFSGSPVIVNDKLLNVSASGVVQILKANNVFERVGEIDLGEPVRSTIVPMTDKLLIRSEASLFIVHSNRQ